jgi:CAAX protease family protein
MLTVARKHPVSAGFVVMFAFTWPIDLWAAAASRGWVVAPPPILPLLVGYGFVVAAILMSGIVDGPGSVRTLLRRYLVWRVSVRWYVVVLLGPAMIYTAAVALHLALGGRLEEPFIRNIVGPETSLWAVAPLFFLFGVVTNGEEIGWRGYALPRLQDRHGALVASLVIGCVWTFWHVPKLLTEGGPGYPIWLFVLDTMAKAVLFTWIFNRTGGSLLTVTLLHASVNTSEVFLPVLPTAGSARPFALSVALLCLAAIIVIVTTGGHRLNDPEGRRGGTGLERRGFVSRSTHP